MDASFWSGLQFWIPLVVPVNTDVARVRPVHLSLESFIEVFGEKRFRDNGVFLFECSISGRIDLDSMGRSLFYGAVGGYG